MILAAAADTEQLLSDNKDILEAVAGELLEKETITLEDIDRIIGKLRPEEAAAA